MNVKKVFFFLEGCGAGKIKKTKKTKRGLSLFFLEDAEVGIFSVAKREGMWNDGSARAAAHEAGDSSKERDLLG